MPRLSKPITPLPSNEVSPTTLSEALDRWYVYLASSERIGSPRTITTYKYGTDKLVAAVAASTPLSSVKPEDIEALLAAMKADGKSPAGRAVVFRPLRTFFRWCVTRGLLHNSPAEKVEAPKAKVQPVEFVTDEQFAAIVATTRVRSKWAFRNRRDKALLLLFGTTGARLSEVAGLTVSDVDMEAGTLLVHGKGGQDRRLPILPDVAAALTDYLSLERPRSPYKDLPDLWLASRGPFGSSGIAQMLAERAKAAGLTRRVHPHELRHRFVAQALSGGMPGPLVMALVSLPRGAVVPAKIIAQHGTTFTLRATSYPDLVDTSPTDPLTEGVAPAALKLGIDTQDYTVQQTGARTVVTDIAQLQSPHNLASVATDKIQRLAAEKIDAIGKAALTTLTTTNDYGTALDSWLINDWVAMARAADFEPIQGVGYYCILHPNALAGLTKEDSLNGYIDTTAQVAGGNLTKGAVGQYKGMTFLTSTKYVDTLGNYPVFVMGANSIACGDVGSITYHPWSQAGVGNELQQLIGFGFKGILGAEVLDFSGTADGAGTNEASVPRVLRFGVASGVSGF